MDTVPQLGEVLPDRTPGLPLSFKETTESGILNLAKYQFGGCCFHAIPYQPNKCLLAYAQSFAGCQGDESPVTAIVVLPSAFKTWKQIYTVGTRARKLAVWFLAGATDEIRSVVANRKIERTSTIIDDIVEAETATAGTKRPRADEAEPPVKRAKAGPVDAEPDSDSKG